MKTDNQAIDKLMRRHAALSVDARLPNEVDSFSKASPGAHLDADELSAFAENALPAATRTRYVAHLADCASCRKIVIDIAGAANVASHITPGSTQEELEPAPRWRQFFNSLFSFPTLRYALPSLAFLVIGGIVWRAYEVPRPQTNTAHSEVQVPPSEVSSASKIYDGQAENTNASSTQAANTSSSPPPASVRREVATEGKAAPGVAASAPSGQNASQSSDAPPGEAPKASPAAPVATQNEAENNYAQQQTDNLSQQVFEQQRDSEEQDSPPAKEKQNKDERSAGESATRESVQVGDKARDASEKTAAPESSASEPRSDARSVSQPARKRQVQRPAARAKSEGNQAIGNAAADDAQSIGGRSFRRESNSWVDTAYRSGQATVNVARASEQYRALVADEPTLRTIAERLSGEAIVVWKGRAYRFR